MENLDFKSLPVDTDYTMSFSDDGSDRNDQENGQANNNENGPQHQRQRGPKGYLSVILLALALVLILGLMLYFFVFRDSSTTRAVSSADIVYSIDYDNDGKADEYDGSLPEGKTFTIYDQTTNPSGVIMPSSVSSSSIVPILVNPSSYSLQLQVVQSNTAANTMYVSGRYVVSNAETGRLTTYQFSFAIDRSLYLEYIIPIVNHVVDANGLTYYNGNNYVYGLESSSSISSWIVPLFLFIAVIGLLIYFYNRMSRSMNGSGGPMAGFVNNIARKENSSKTRFADVAGCDEVKAELVELVDYFHSTDKYTRLGAKLPHGVLLVGPPGTGKTLLAKAVAGEASVPFYSISGSDFVEMYVGVGASRVRSLFKTAKSNAPCLIFIDEIDAVGRQRGAGLGGGNDEREQTLNQLLVEMDGFADNSGIIVMAATNRSDILDPALTRPGRFDRTITVDLPDRKGRADILKVHSRNKKIAPDVTFDDIAGRTVGFSGADLANIMNDAAILAVRANRDAITIADIDEAIDRAISGPAKRSHLEAEEKKQVAYHESGHAVIGIFLPYSDKVQKITIIPRGRTGGHVLMTPEKDRFLLTKNQMIARITGYLGGRTSEELFFGDVSTGASNDIEVATSLARAMVTQYGMSELGPIQYEKPGGSVFLGRDYTSSQANYSTQIAYEIDKAVRSIIDECHEKAKALLLEHKDDVALIADTLIERETITSEEISYLLKNRCLPPVDEHKLQGTDGVNPKNVNNIILYPGYEPFYIAADKIMEGEPSRFVLVVATGSGTPIDRSTFRNACVSGAKDPSKIGMMFLEFSQSMRISLSVETFASHIESYVGTPVLLIKTDDNSVKNLKAIYDRSENKREDKKEEETPTDSANNEDRPGVVEEILPNTNKEETTDDSDSGSNDEENTKQGGN